jgi:peptidoglycan/LPS O-acetylase OafA/YrhL
LGTFRLMLAWLVIAGHTPKYYELFDLELGTPAISAFFFISGFLMPMAYETYYRQTSFWPGFKRFVINRFLRIYPIYWLSLLLLILYGLLPFVLSKNSQVAPALTELINYPQNFMLIGLNQSKLWGGYERFNNPAWTLDVELQFYLLVPFLILALSRHRRIVVILSMISASIISVYLLYSPAGLVDIDRSLVAWSLPFFLGVLFYKSVGLQEFFAHNGSLLIAAPPLALAGLTENPDMRTVAVTMVLVVIASYLLVRQKNFQFGRLDRLAGDLSYPTYILHILCVSITAMLLTKIQNYYGLTQSLGYFYPALSINIIISSIAAYYAVRFVAEPIDRFRMKFKKTNR